MNWAQTRQAARTVVHSTFALNARYYSAPTATLGLLVSVRVHSKINMTGALGNEGFSKSFEDNETVVFTALDVEQLGIKKGGILKLDDGRVLRLQVRNAVLDDFTVEFMVTRV